MSTVVYDAAGTLVLFAACLSFLPSTPTLKAYPLLPAIPNNFYRNGPDLAYGGAARIWNLPPFPFSPVFVWISLLAQSVSFLLPSSFPVAKVVSVLLTVTIQLCITPSLSLPEAT